MKNKIILILGLLVFFLFMFGCVETSDDEFIPEELEGMEYEEEKSALAGQVISDDYEIIRGPLTFNRLFQCKSTDGNFENFLEKGKTICLDKKNKRHIFTEFCYKNDLIEYYEDLNQYLKYVQVRCPYGCYDGACSVCKRKERCIREECGIIDDNCGGTINCSCFEGKVCNEGQCVQSEIDISGLNQKDLSKYSENEVFIISDENWKDVLTLVSMTTWTEENIVNKYPTLVYHKEGENIDVDSLIHFLQQYQPNKITIIGDVPQQLGDLLIAEPDFGVGVDNSQINSIGINEYLSYWNNPEAFIYVEDDYESALLASTYASLFNAPLIIEGTVFDSDNILNDKIVVCIGDVDRECTVNYDLNQITEKYLERTNTNKVILVNPNDLTQSVNSPVLIEKTVGDISNAYGKTSLMAPFLASAKQQLLLSYPLGNYEDDMNQIISKFNEMRTFLQSKLSSLNLEPEYLTIMASHIAIPESYYDGVHRRFLLDWKYVTDEDPTNNGNPDPAINVGRILGITPTDVSSYIVRTIFYDDVYDNVYSTDEHNVLAIGHSFTVFSRNAEYTLEKAEEIGYTGDCFRDNSRESERCSSDYFHMIDSDYQNKQVITFEDHGTPDSWVWTLSYDEIPLLDLPYINTLTCYANTAWEGESNTFGPNMLRKGAISYSGGLGLVPELTGVCKNDNTRDCRDDYGTCDGTHCCLPNVYTYDLDTNEINQMTNNYAVTQYMAVSNDNHIVWVDYREHQKPELFSYNFINGEEQQITSYHGHYSINNAEVGIISLTTKFPAVNGDKLVFQGRYSDGGYGYSILFCELNPGSEYYCYDKNLKQVSSHLSSKRSYPDIHENIVVWKDERNDEGDVYMCDLTAESEYECGVNERRLTFDGKQYYPKVYGNNIVWKYYSEGVLKIQSYNILTEQTTTYEIENNPYFNEISNDLILADSTYKLHICSLNQDDPIACGSGNEIIITPEEGIVRMGSIYGNVIFYSNRLFINDHYEYRLYYCSLIGGDEYECGVNPRLIDNGYQEVTSAKLFNNKIVLSGIKGCTDQCISNGFPGSKSFIYLKDEPEQSLGELNTKLLMDDWLNGGGPFNGNGYHYNKYNLFLGDPTLEPRWT
jgi:beta propeller repeat protein